MYQKKLSELYAFLKDNNHKEAGRDDLHGLNFGFRNGKFVFFDA